MSNWEKLDDVSKSIADEPWSLYWREFDATSDAFQKFIADPLSVMSAEIAEIGPDWRVQTHVIGHEVGLTRGIVCTIPMVDLKSKTVFVTLYKHD
jgi:hypothetical protein